MKQVEANEAARKLVLAQSKECLQQAQIPSGFVDASSFLPCSCVRDGFSSLLCSLFFSSAAFFSGAILADSSAAFYPAAILADSSAAFLAASSSAAFAAASFSTVFFSVANRVSHLRSHLLGFDPRSICMHNRIEESCSKLWVTGFIPNALIWIKLFGHASRSADS